MGKISDLNKEQIKAINAYLRKKGYAPFTAKEIKAVQEDVLGVCYANDEIAVRGMIYPYKEHKAIALRSSYAYTEVLIIEFFTCNPMKIAERFDVVSFEIEDDE